jgi:outer membrane protein OmpA-like peptidoglycan-associated protein
MADRRFWGALVPFAAGLVLTACSVVPGYPVAVPGAQPSGGNATQPGGDGVRTYAGGPVLASRTGTDPDGNTGEPFPFQVDLNEVRVSGRLMQVTLTARNPAPPVNVVGETATENGWQISDTFTDGITQGVLEVDAFSADGIYVVDPAADRRYLPGRIPVEDGDGTSTACACSTHLSDRFVPGGDGTEITALFAAPAPGTSTVDVFVPNVGMFPGIPVSTTEGQPVPRSARTLDTTSSSKHTPLQVEVTELAADDQSMRVVLTAHNLDQPDPARHYFADGEWPVEKVFWNSVSSEPEYENVSGVQAVDTGAGQRYLVARDQSGTCICSGGLLDVEVGSGTAVVLAGTFAAPPPQVEKMDIFVPYVGTFADVPVTRAQPGPLPAPTPQLQVVPPPDLPIAEAPVQDIVFPEATADGAILDKGDGDFRLASDVLFEFDRADLTPRATTELTRVADELRAAGATTVEVVGHTDDIGEDAYNTQLSQARAESVREALDTALGPGVTIQATGRGESEPIADNTTVEGQAANRRVEVTVG